jgi:hypothetical protein
MPPRNKTAFVLEYAAQVREKPGALMQVVIPGGLLVGRPGYVRVHGHLRLLALPEGSFDDLLETQRENTKYLAFEDAVFYTGALSVPVGYILIDASQVSAWGVCDLKP